MKLYIRSASSNYQSAYNAAKQRILDCIASPTKRVAVVLKPHEQSLDEDARERIIHNLYGDDDIIQALADAGVYRLITNQSDSDGSCNGGARFWKSKKKTNWGGGQEL